MSMRSVRLVAAIVVVAVISAACQTGVRAGTRCRTTDFGDDGTYVLKCVNGRWVRAATKAQVAKVLIAILKARQAAATPAPAPAAVPAAAPAGTALGIDVSRWQHPNNAVIDWAAVRNAGYKFAFIKATEGPAGGAGDYVNPYFAGDWAGSGSVGLLRGAYHYARPLLPVSSALLQARNFVATAGSMAGPIDLPPVLDIENSGGLSPADLVSWIGTWLNEVERLTGRRPMIYTGLNFWNGATGGSSAFSSYRLWFARYVAGDSPGTLPTGFASSTFWQFTSSGSVPGIVAAVDLNRYCCTDALLAALAGPSTNSGAGSPFGSFDVAAGLPDGKINVQGWSIDPDLVGGIETQISIDGVVTSIGRSNVDRTDVRDLYPQFGLTHGFNGTIPGNAPGSHSVCASAINESYGQNTALGCATVVVPSGPPIGVIDSASATPAGDLTVAGWALDPDTAAPIQIRVTVDGTPVGPVTANGSRPDVATAHPGYGALHGYTASASGLTTGSHSVCVAALNVGAGADTALGCRTVTV